MMFRSPKNPPIIAGDKPEISNLELFSRGFLENSDTVELAQSLLGAFLVTRFEEGLTGGRIVETEAYKAPEDKASHAHLNRFTERTKVMFGPAGIAYVYLCYGIHHLFNVVTGPEGEAHAILVRAIEPIWGVDLMKERRDLGNVQNLTNGPGKLTQALGIKTRYTGKRITGKEDNIQLYQPLEKVHSVITSKRIGVDYAEESKDWPWRFYDGQSDFVSKR